MILTREVVLHIAVSTFYLVCTWFYFLPPREVPSVQSETLWLCSASQYGCQCLFCLKFRVKSGYCTLLIGLRTIYLTEIYSIYIKDHCELRWVLKKCLFELIQPFEVTARSRSDLTLNLFVVKKTKRQGNTDQNYFLFVHLWGNWTEGHL